MDVKDIVLVEGARTPFGTYCGSLKDSSAIDLGVVASQGAIQRAGVSPQDVGRGRCFFSLFIARARLSASLPSRR